MLNTADLDLRRRNYSRLLSLPSTMKILVHVKSPFYEVVRQWQPSLGCGDHFKAARINAAPVIAHWHYGSTAISLSSAGTASPSPGSLPGIPKDLKNFLIHGKRACSSSCRPIKQCRAGKNTYPSVQDRRSFPRGLILHRLWTSHSALISGRIDDGDACHCGRAI